MKITSAGASPAAAETCTRLYRSAICTDWISTVMPLSSMKALSASSFGGTPQGGARNEMVVSCAAAGPAKPSENKNSSRTRVLTNFEIFISVLL